MSDDGLSIQGTLAETTVPDLFRSLLRSSETGIVSLEAIGRNDVIYFMCWLNGSVHVLVRLTGENTSMHSICFTSNPGHGYCAGNHVVRPYQRV